MDEIMDKYKMFLKLKSEINDLRYDVMLVKYDCRYLEKSICKHDNYETEPTGDGYYKFKCLDCDYNEESSEKYD